VKRRAQRITEGERASEGRVCSEYGTLNVDRRAIQSSAWKDDQAAVGWSSNGDHGTGRAIDGMREFFAGNMLQQRELIGSKTSK
jgi:hypothetical protein